MLYELQQGAHEAKIVEQAQKLGMPLPAVMANKPRLLMGLDFYWRAFWELSTDRDIGMAEGPIPWTAMNQWAIRYNIVNYEFDRFVILIKGMDSVYIDHRTKQHKKKLSSASKGGGKSSGSFINTKGK